MQKYAVIVAGGSGSRMQTDIPKQFISVGGLPVLMHTLNRFAQSVPNLQIILVLPQAHFDTWAQLCQQYKFTTPHQLIEGGNTRFASVKNGLAAIPNNEGLVAIHDGVRPFVAVRAIQESFAVAQAKGNAIVAVNLKDSIRYVEENQPSKAMERSKFKLIQTPQTFQVAQIKAAYNVPYNDTFTDDASVAEAFGQQITLIEGNYENIKITTPEDLLVASVFVQQNRQQKIK
jgi:2-C-methyl-D-erythritol 4-phosphate cytidylyltransferase